VWRATVVTLECGRLVFVDEMGIHTSLVPLYGYSPRGQRTFFKIPRNKGTNTTLLSSMSSDGMGPSMAVEGSTTKEVFETYIEHFLAPVLASGQLVVRTTFLLIRERGSGSSSRTEAANYCTCLPTRRT
jgi:hypothetical protein